MSKMDQATFGNRLRTTYEAADFTRASFARKLGVGYNTVWRYEKGENFPSSDVLSGMAEALGAERFRGLVDGLDLGAAARGAALLANESNAPDGTASEHYATLLEAIGERLEHRRGWQRKAASALGVSPSLVSNVLSKGHAVASDTIDLAKSRLGMPDEFFVYGGDALAWLNNATADLALSQPAPDDDAEADSSTDEVDVMRSISDLDPAARSRVLAWASSKWGVR